MKVRRIDSDGDWTFGQGLANYACGSEAIRQNVTTRIKSFKNDWFLDYGAEIDWFNILANKNNEKTILREVSRVTLGTAGVARITVLRVDGITKRDAQITLSFVTIFDDSFNEVVSI
jgi:hypothetical protein